MYRTTLHLKKILLLAGDFAALQLALIATLLLRYGTIDIQTWSLHQFPFFIISILWALGLFVTGLYDLTRANNSLTYLRTFIEGMFINLLVAFAFFYMIPFGIEPRTNLLLFFATSLLLIYTWRIIFNRFVAKGLFKTQLLFIGTAEEAIAFRDLIAQSTLGFQLTQVIHTTPRTSYSADGIQWTDQTDRLLDIVKNEHISAIVLGHAVAEKPEVEEALYQSLFLSTSIIDRKEIEETLTGRISLSSVNKGWFLEHLRESEKSWYESFKRFWDILLAIPFLILTAIITPIVAILMLTTSSGSLFFIQERVGKNGKRFNMVKFRTMHHPKGQSNAESSGAQFATQNDPRVTPIGKWMRKLRIDELPQVWNVLKGDMSFIGPRPERPEFVEQLTERMPYYALRHLTRPGLTGWAQVRYRYASTLDDNLVKLQYDLFYVKNRSMLLDAAILLKTINTVLRSQGT